MNDPLSPSQIAELRERADEGWSDYQGRDDIDALLATVEAQAAVIERGHEGWQHVAPTDEVLSIPKGVWFRFKHPNEPMSLAEQVVVYGEVIEGEERSDG